MNRFTQYLRPHDRRFGGLLGRLHALRLRRHTQELPPLRMPFRQLYRTERASIQISELLEVSLLPWPIWSDCPARTYISRNTYPTAGRHEQWSANGVLQPWRSREVARAEG